MSDKSDKDDRNGPDDLIRDQWDSLNREDGLTTRQKLERLVSHSIKRSTLRATKAVPPPKTQAKIEGAVTVREYSYPLPLPCSNIDLIDWREMQPRHLSLLTGDEAFSEVDPRRLVYFDTETTGLAGGTGTIPFMLGFGFFGEKSFEVKIYILNDLSEEDAFLDEVDRFLQQNTFSATVTYNGKAFDFPLMETRYILHRRRFPLLEKAHLDFLFPARMIWKHSFDSRKLGFLGDALLGLSRSEDIDASQIPMIYFNYLRGEGVSLMDRVAEHNALDLVGLAGLLMLGAGYVIDPSRTRDEGETLGVATLFERGGDYDEARRLYRMLREDRIRDNVKVIAIRQLSRLTKRKKLYEEASELWQILGEYDDHYALKELAIHHEHRRRDYRSAMEVVQQAMARGLLTEPQKRDLEHRLQRLQKKMTQLEAETGDDPEKE